MKHSEYMKKKQDQIIKNESLDTKLFDFYLSVFTLQEGIAFTGDLLAQYKDTISKGVYPSLTSEKLVLDDKTLSALCGLMEKLTVEISGMNPGLDFSQVTENFSNDAEALLRALLNSDYTFIEQNGLKNRLAIEEFLFILFKVYKPFLIALRESYFTKPDKEEWMEGTCPFCGYLPDMSKIVESKENRRVLHCALCENEWEFPRLVCASCGCNEQSKNGFFEHEDNKNYRAYYCDECRHYIKSVRIPKLSEETSFDLTVEDIITGFIDAAMIEKGYKRI